MTSVDQLRDVLGGTTSGRTGTPEAVEVLRVMRTEAAVDMLALARRKRTLTSSYGVTGSAGRARRPGHRPVGG